MNKLDKTHIIEKFHKFVYDNNLTLEVVGAEIPLNPSTVARILNGDTPNPHPRTLHKLKEYLRKKGVSTNA